MTQTTTSVEVTEGAGACPVTNFRMQGVPRPPLSTYHELDELRGHGPTFQLAEPGHYIYTQYEQILEIAQERGPFSNQMVDPATGEPLGFELVPQTMDGDIHAKWRKVLGRYFSPGRAERLSPTIRARAIELIESFADRGHCDFMTEFAQRYPTAIFLGFMGLPLDRLDDFMEWEHRILHPRAASAEEAMAEMYQAQTEVTAYLAEQLAAVRATPVEERGDDLMSEALTWQIDGEPLSDKDLLSFYLLMFEAGLDTVTAELGWCFLHLATHPADRDRIVSDPDIIEKAVEELLRVYPMVNIGRLVVEDTNVGGLPLKKGDRVMLSLPSAGRDETIYPDATKVDFDRENVSHLTFGAGPHRCLGSHLARHELAVALEEFHKRIPNYRVDENATIAETHNAMFGLINLPLVWDPSQP
jgi:cytochrome P450